MNEKNLYIKPDEEITSVIDRLIKMKSVDVYLVVPKAAVLAQSLVNFKLLKREANNLRKNITIISEDDNVQRLAKKADFNVKDFLPEPVPPEILDEEEEPAPPVKKFTAKKISAVQEDDADEISDAVAPIAKRIPLVGARTADLRGMRKPQNENDDILDDEMPKDEFRILLKEKNRASSPRINDIIRSGASAPVGKVMVRTEDEEEVESEKEPEEEDSIKLEYEMPEFSGKRKSDAEEDEPSAEELMPFDAVSHQTVKNEFSKGLSRPDVTGPSSGGYPFWRRNESSIGNFSRPNRQMPEEMAGKNKVLSSFPAKIFGLFVGSAIVIAGLVFFLVLPKADVTILAKHEKVPFSLVITADKNLNQVDESAGRVPAQLVKLDETQSMDFPTTGVRQLNDKASGMITVYNAYSSSPQTLVETTRFLSSQGKIYRLTKTVTIPGAKIDGGKIIASSFDVSVAADQPGEDYNVGPTSFTIPGFQGTAKYDGFYAKSSAGLSGGYIGTAKVMTQDDLNKAQAQISDALVKKAQDDLSGQIPSGSKLLDGAIQSQIVDSKPSVGVGEKADNFALNVRAQAQALIFSEGDIENLAEKNIAPSVGDKADVAGSPAMNYSDIKISLDKGQMSFTVSGEQDIIWKVDRDAIKKIIVGKSQDEVKGLLSGRPEIQEANFSLWPFWIKSIPSQLDKINITVN